MRSRHKANSNAHPQMARPHPFEDKWIDRPSNVQKQWTVIRFCPLSTYPRPKIGPRLRSNGHARMARGACPCPPLAPVEDTRAPFFYSSPPTPAAPPPTHRPTIPVAIVTIFPRSCVVQHGHEARPLLFHSPRFLDTRSCPISAA